MKPYLHAQTSVRKHGGTPEDYLPIHEIYAHVPRFVDAEERKAIAEKGSQTGANLAALAITFNVDLEDLKNWTGTHQIKSHYVFEYAYHESCADLTTQERTALSRLESSLESISGILKMVLTEDGLIICHKDGLIEINDYEHD